MLSLQAAKDLIKKKDYKIDERILQWQKVYYNNSLHIDGVMPYYWSLRNPELGWINTNTIIRYPLLWGGQIYQRIFEERLFSRHPREPFELRQWRFSQYNPLQKAAFIQAIQVITGAIFQDSGYSITVTNEKVNDYVWENSFDGKDLVGYISAKFQEICSDPNGLFIVIPKKSRQETDGPVEPEIRFIPTKYLLFHTREEIIYKDGDVHWLINSIGYFRFHEVEGELVNMDGENDGYYMHGLNHVPVIIAGGTWNGQGYYDSWLDAARAQADEFVKGKSSEAMAWKESSHPYITEMSLECPECENGKLQYCTECKCSTSSCECNNSANYTLTNCSHCHGTGIISRNPGQHVVLPAEMMDKDGVKIVVPPIEIPEALAKNNEYQYKQILQALHLNYIEEAQSGVAKDKDMETRYQFILRIANDLFDRLIPFFIEHISALMNVTVSEEGLEPGKSDYTIIKPTQYQIKTAQDLLDEFKTAQEAEVPLFVKQQLLTDWVDKLYGGDNIMKRKTMVINQSDVLAGETTANIQIKILNGSVTQRDAQYNSYLPMLLDRVINERGREWFLTAKFEDIETTVKALFAKTVPPPLELPDTNVREDV